MARYRLCPNAKLWYGFGQIDWDGLFSVVGMPALQWEREVRPA